MAAPRAAPAPGRSGVRRGPAILITGGLALLAGGLIVVALLRPQPPTFVPTVAAVPDSTGAFRVTIDARDHDSWRFVELPSGTLVGPNQRWDLAFRRFHVITNGGRGFSGRAAVRDLGPASIDSIREAPADGYVLTSADSIHPVLDDWYHYGITSHLLSPRGHVYAVRTTDGRTALLEFLGYYCPGATPGCVTIRFRSLPDAPPVQTP